MAATVFICVYKYCQSIRYGVFMVEYRAVVLDYCEAKREGAAQLKDVEVSINVLDVLAEGERATVRFEYLARFLPKVGFVKLAGSVFIDGKPNELKLMVDYWARTKTLPKETSETVLNLANLSAGVNGVLVTRAIELPPPFMPPKLTIVKK
jgi:hypothetical protein